MSLVEGRRLSWPRLGVVLVAAGAIVFASLQGWRGFQDARADVPQESWFAPYVDVTVTPTLQFEEAPSGAGPNTVLAFVVADPEHRCDPSWGGAYTMDEASEQLDLDRRIARVRQLGGTPIVAFGGQANTELAVACSDGEDLYDAYHSVVTRYDVQVIDLDVEGESLLDANANDRRAEALARLQTEQDLSVWVTLPVSPDGLTEDGERLVSSMLAAGVDLAGINAMTMNYGGSKDSGQSMAAASLEALESMHTQVAQLYEDSGRHLTPAQVWRRIGATPMLGQNDIAGEVFGLRDAELLHEFASENRLGRISMWSLNRDRACSGNYPDVSIVSDSCSGVDQADSAFSAILGRALEGAPQPYPTTSATVDPTATPTDDPETSPYPIWTEDGVYQGGERVVWRQTSTPRSGGPPASCRTTRRSRSRRPLGG